VRGCEGCEHEEGYVRGCEEGVRDVRVRGGEYVRGCEGYEGVRRGV